ncbi:Hpt domain-containing protein [Algoriphagus chordae]|uniref:HPt domain-containing protein n=1 Tax=Algoriphagus chordae TaxID=237019 RepID=A0A2W7RET3_9BACT|nr:Hpt domain-containing protein [Algoriphagus chordae]PZX54127.1 hypothetical protein LV85_01466 [Algoriphagus chordae]
MYQLISEQSIYQYFGEDEPEMIKEMVQIILDTNIKNLKEMNKAPSQEDFKSIKQCCHKARPSMIYIGAHNTHRTLEEIENNPDKYQTLNESLQAQLLAIETELHQFLEALN